MITRRRFVDGAVASIAGASVASTTRNYLQIFGAGERADSIRKRLNEGGAAPRVASKTVGLVVPDPFQRFFAEVAASLLNTLTLHEYGLIISSSRGNADLEDQVIRQMLGRNVDALVVASCKSHTEVLEPAAREVPLVLLDRRIGESALRFVGTDDALAGELATRHLIDIGCRQIAYIGAAVSSSSDRERACRAVLSRNNIDISDEYLMRTSGNGESDHVLGKKHMQRILTLTPRPDGVFCYSDPIAWGAMTAILDAGLRIPEDIAVVGCGNTLYNSLMKVPLTSVDQNTASLGSAAAELSVRAIEQHLHQRRLLPETVLLKPTLVMRESTIGAKPQPA